MVMLSPLAQAGRRAGLGEPLCLVEETFPGRATMRGDHRRAARHDQECAPGNSLDVAAETENESRDEIYDAPGFRIPHVLQVDDYRDFLAEVLADGGGILKVPWTHYGDLDSVAERKLTARGLIVVLGLTEAIGSIPVVVFLLDATEPSAGVAWHYAYLRRYELIHGRPSGETAAQVRNRSEPDFIKL